MTYPEPLQPIYDFASAPEPVELFSEELTLLWEGGSQTTSAEVFLHFIPKPQIFMESKLSGLAVRPLNLLLNNKPGISYHLGGQEINIFVKKLDWNLDEHMRVQLTPSVEPAQGFGDVQSDISAAAIFHLFNFPDFSGGQHQTALAPSGYKLLVLESEDWKIAIQSLRDNDTCKAWKRIKEGGGCFLTHVMKMERQDGELFSGEDAKEQCFLVANFLSFAKGGKCWPICGIGINTAGERIWGTFASPCISNPPYSWFSPYKASQLELLFPLFVKRWQQSGEWKDCLRSSIYWYVQANIAGKGDLHIDSAIILAQSALERLAHHYLVVDRKMISNKGFDDLRASDRLRMLFTVCGIPNEITDATPDILQANDAFKKNAKWMDAPHAITDIRNSLVHPVSKKNVCGCYVDAWKLSLWYLELSVLALCGYNGTYTSRLTAKYVTDSENVPWGKKA